MSFQIPAEFEKEAYDPNVSLTDKSQVFFIRVPKGNRYDLRHASVNNSLLLKTFLDEEFTIFPHTVDDFSLVTIFDVKKLDGKKFSTHHVNEVGKEDGPGDLNTVYSLTPYRNKDLGIEPLILSDGKVTTGGKVKGLLSLTKSYEAKVTPGLPKPQLTCPGSVPMPCGLRTRFTPFGAGSPVKIPAQKTKENSHKGSLDVSGESSCTETQDTHRKKRRKLSSSDSPAGTIETPQKKKKERQKDTELNDSKVTEPTKSNSELAGLNGSLVSSDSLKDSVTSSKKKKKKKRSKESDSSGMDVVSAFADSNVSAMVTEEAQVEDEDRVSEAHTQSPLQTVMYFDRNGNGAAVKKELFEQLQSAGSPVKIPAKKAKKNSHKRSLDISGESSYTETRDTHRKKRRKLSRSDGPVEAIETPQKKEEKKEKDTELIDWNVAELTKSNAEFSGLNGSLVSSDSLTDSVTSSKKKKKRKHSKESGGSGMDVVSAFADSNVSAVVTEEAQVEDEDRVSEAHTQSPLQTVMYYDRSGGGAAVAVKKELFKQLQSTGTGSDFVSSQSTGHSNEALEKKKKSHSRVRSLDMNIKIKQEPLSDSGSRRSDEILKKKRKIYSMYKSIDMIKNIKLEPQGDSMKKKKK